MFVCMYVLDVCMYGVAIRIDMHMDEVRNEYA